MKKFIDWMDSAPLLLKIILALPAVDIIWVVYRICRSFAKENMLGLILGIVLIIVGIPFLWLVDIITLILMNKVIWID